MVNVDKMNSVNSKIQQLYGPGMKSLAPMVRAGTMPLRLVCARYGADAVYAEEIIDHKMIKTKRHVEDTTGIVTYYTGEWGGKSERKVFQTCHLEKDKVVFQVGTSDATRAVKVAEMVSQDVAGFDVNMGCPKKFSVSGGMGAALLQSPEVAEDILKALRRNITDIPITCKIRLMEDEKKSVELIKRLEAAGAQAIGVHMREIPTRPSEPAMWERLKPLVDAVSVPVIANGDLYSKSDMKKVMEKSGCSSFMFARGALANPSVFLPGESAGSVLLYDVLKQYMSCASAVENGMANTAYTTLQMRRYAKSDRRVEALVPLFQQNKSQISYDDIFKVLDMEPVQKAASTLTWESLGLNLPTLDKEPNAKRQRVE